MREVTFVLPLPPNVANMLKGRHWSTRRRWFDAWEVHAIATEKQLHGYREPMKKAEATAIFYVGNHPKHRRDDDNAIASLKPVIDLLKKKMWIVDDDTDRLTLVGKPEQRLGTPRRLELTLKEIP